MTSPRRVLARAALLAVTLAAPGCLCTYGLWEELPGPEREAWEAAQEVRAWRVDAPGRQDDVAGRQYVVEARGTAGWAPAAWSYRAGVGATRVPAVDALPRPEAAEALPVVPTDRDDEGGIRWVRVEDGAVAFDVPTLVPRRRTLAVVGRRAAQVLLTPPAVAVDLLTWPLQFLLLGSDVWVATILLFGGDLP